MIEPVMGSENNTNLSSEGLISKTNLKQIKLFLCFNRKVFLLFKVSEL